MRRIYIYVSNAFKVTQITNSTCGKFTKNKEKRQKLKETGHSRHFYQHKLDKACGHHDMDGSKIYVEEQLVIR